MLGKLAQRLRLLGVDAGYERTVSGMAAYRRARSEGRLFLTRNRRLQHLPEVILVESEKPEEQVQELTGRLGLKGPAPVEEKGVLSRCLVCNEVLARVSREEARPAVPFFIYQIHNEFRRCPKCRRVYWPGSHVENMLQREGKRNI